MNLILDFDCGAAGHRDRPRVMTRDMFARVVFLAAMFATVLVVRIIAT